MSLKHGNIIKQMSLEEKALMMSGKNVWQTQDFPQYRIPSMMQSDGPHGMRTQPPEACDHLGINASIPATCFPTAATLANTWDENLVEEMGKTLATEAVSMGVHVVLGPGLNIKRSPLCGRNFEYYSEDPYHAGKMAASLIKGIQSLGISACPKHYAANSQELRRMAMNSVVDEIKSTVSDLDFVAAVNNTSYSSNSVKSLSEVFAIDTVLLYDTKRTVSLSNDVLELVEIDNSQTVEFSDGSIAEYIMADEKYIVYFTCSEKSLLIVPEGFDVTNIEEKYRNADTIILSDCPENFELLSCDTLIVNEGGAAGHNLMKLTHSISNRVLFTDDGDIKIVI